jgi:hypothetical protein
LTVSDETYEDKRTYLDQRCGSQSGDGKKGVSWRQTMHCCLAIREAPNPRVNSLPQEMFRSECTTRGSDRTALAAANRPDQEQVLTGKFTNAHYPESKSI